ncbi:ankyrin repeat domain-containing protein 49-like [Haliotis asinina]|uniref:ankyrin repeat domain-containing protein 49-like n=1 Tax=Haliotis asinina TaxID=109174 RepID=UPI0035318339
MAEPDDYDDIPDQLDPECADVLHKILQAKDGEPNKFQSFWENDEDDVSEFTQEEIENDPEKRILWAAENNKLAIVEEMLGSCPRLVHSHDVDGYTPLHRASYNGHLDIAKCLYSHGADISAKTVDGWQPLHSASRWNSTSVASFLLDCGADINAQTNGGLTPLHLASSEQDSRETLELLLMNPFIDASIKTKVGETAKQICQRTSSHHWLFEIVDDSVNKI